MGAAASTTSYKYKTAEEALAAGKSQLEVHAHVAAATYIQAFNARDEAAIRALTGVQMLVPGLYFFGEQLFGLVGRAPPEVVASMHANPIMALGAFFGVHALQSTLKSINAFEITYNGNLSLIHI